MAYQEAVERWDENDLRRLRGYVAELRCEFEGLVVKVLRPMGEEDRAKFEAIHGFAPMPEAFCPLCSTILPRADGMLFRAHLLQIHADHLTQAHRMFEIAKVVGVKQSFAPHIHPMYKRLLPSMELLPDEASSDEDEDGAGGGKTQAPAVSSSLYRFFLNLQLQFAVCEVFNWLYLFKTLDKELHDVLGKRYETPHFSHNIMTVDIGERFGLAFVRHQEKIKISLDSGWTVVG